MRSGNYPQICIRGGRFAYWTSNFQRRSFSNKWRLLVMLSMLRRFWAEVFSVPSKIGTKKSILLRKLGRNCNFVFGTPRNHILTRHDVTWRIDCNNWCRALGCSALEESSLLREVKRGQELGPRPMPESWDRGPGAAKCWNMKLNYK